MRGPGDVCDRPVSPGLSRGGPPGAPRGRPCLLRFRALGPRSARSAVTTSTGSPAARSAASAAMVVSPSAGACTTSSRGWVGQVFDPRRGALQHQVHAHVLAEVRVDPATQRGSQAAGSCGRAPRPAGRPACGPRPPGRATSRPVGSRRRSPRRRSRAARGPDSRDDDGRRQAIGGTRSRGSFDAAARSSSHRVRRRPARPGHRDRHLARPAEGHAPPPPPSPRRWS